jgi:carbamoyl-phosphate synthase large subunit
MALSARYGQQAASLLRQRCLVESRSAVLRSFSTANASRSAIASLPLKQQHATSVLRSQQLRMFSSCLRRLATDAQAAPSAHSYLASGAIKRSADLVDVKKVLVIGSGGLSIGQAGEFDYSGVFSHILYL